MESRVLKHEPSKIKVEYFRETANGFMKFECALNISQSYSPALESSTLIYLLKLVGQIRTLSSESYSRALDFKCGMYHT